MTQSPQPNDKPETSPLIREITNQPNDEALAQWMESLGFRLKPDQYGNKRFDKWIGPNGMNTFSDEAAFFHQAQEAAVLAGKIDQAVNDLWSVAHMSRKDAHYAIKNDVAALQAQQATLTGDKQ